MFILAGLNDIFSLFAIRGIFHYKRSKGCPQGQRTISTRGSINSRIIDESAPNYDQLFRGFLDSARWLPKPIETAREPLIYHHILDPTGHRTPAIGLALTREKKNILCNFLTPWANQRREFRRFIYRDEIFSDGSELFLLFRSDIGNLSTLPSSARVFLFGDQKFLYQANVDIEQAERVSNSTVPPSASPILSGGARLLSLKSNRVLKPSRTRFMAEWKGQVYADLGPVYMEGGCPG